MTLFLHWRTAGPEKIVTSIAVTEDIISHRGHHRNTLYLP